MVAQDTVRPARGDHVVGHVRLAPVAVRVVAGEPSARALRGLLKAAVTVVLMPTPVVATPRPPLPNPCSLPAKAPGAARGWEGQVVVARVTCKAGSLHRNARRFRWDRSRRDADFGSTASRS